MNTLPQIIKNYLKNCQEQKRLDAKTIKAYQIDLTQFYIFFKKFMICYFSSFFEDSASSIFASCSSVLKGLSLSSFFKLL